MQSITQFKTEGSPAFPVVEETGTDNPAGSSPDEETTPDAQTPTPEGEQDPEQNKDAGGEEEEDRGFADHPRWKQREEDWKKRFNDQETRHTQELDKLRKEIEDKFSAVKPKDETPVEVPEWFGGDEDQWTQFQEWNNSLIEKAKEQGRNEAKQEVEQKTTEEQKAIEEATEYMNSEIAAIESDKDLNPTGAKIDKNKLLKIVLDNDLVDTQGRWNYKAGYRLMQNQGANSNLNDKKKIAAATTSDKKPESKAESFMTSEDFQNPSVRPW